MSGQGGVGEGAVIRDLRVAGQEHRIVAKHEKIFHYIIYK